MPIFAPGQEQKRERRGLALALVLTGLLLFSQVVLLAVAMVQPMAIPVGRYRLGLSYEDDRYTSRGLVV